MTASMSSSTFRCSHFQRQQWEYCLPCVTASWVPYLEHYLVRDMINFLVRIKASLPRINDLTRQPAVGDRQKNKNKKRYPGCLAHVVSGMFYSAVANRRQPNLYKIGGGNTGGKAKTKTSLEPTSTSMVHGSWCYQCKPSLVSCQVPLNSQVGEHWSTTKSTKEYPHCPYISGQSGTRCWRNGIHIHTMVPGIISQHMLSILPDYEHKGPFGLPYITVPSGLNSKCRFNVGNYTRLFYFRPYIHKMSVIVRARYIWKCSVSSGQTGMPQDPLPILSKSRYDTYSRYIYGRCIIVAYLEQVDVHLWLAADHALRFFPTKHLQYLKHMPQAIASRVETRNGMHTGRVAPSTVRNKHALIIAASGPPNLLTLPPYARRLTSIQGHTRPTDHRSSSIVQQ